MGLRQDFSFKYDSAAEVYDFLKSLSHAANVNFNSNFFIFSNLSGEPEFTFDGEITSSGLTTDRAGNYFHFLGLFIEAITGQFGKVEVQDI